MEYNNTVSKTLVLKNVPVLKIKHNGHEVIADTLLKFENYGDYFEIQSACIITELERGNIYDIELLWTTRDVRTNGDVEPYMEEYKDLLVVYIELNSYIDDAVRPVYKLYKK